jgi:hypothetical protein
MYQGYIPVEVNHHRGYCLALETYLEQVTSDTGSEEELVEDICRF